MQPFIGIVFLLSVLAGVVPATPLGDDIAAFRSCKECGMDRKLYGYSRMLLVHGDGSQTGVCSLHCALAVQDANRGKPVTAFHVADRNNHILIDAATAYWVVGGSKRGVMTARAKWAFTTEAAADAFVAAYGGKRATWAEALEAASEDAVGKPRADPLAGRSLDITPYSGNLSTSP